MSNHCADFEARRALSNKPDKERSAKIAKLQQSARRSATAVATARRSRPREEDPIDLIARSICKPERSKKARPEPAPLPAPVQKETAVVPVEMGFAERVCDQLRHVRPPLWGAFLTAVSAYGVLQLAMSVSL